jgi:hypothetical protein
MLNLFSLAVGCQGVTIPSSDGASQYDLNGAAVERLGDLRAYAKSFQPPEREEVLLCPLHDCVDVFGS